MSYPRVSGSNWSISHKTSGAHSDSLLPSRTPNASTSPYSTSVVR